MLQVFIPNVSSVFSRRMLQVCLFECCICFTHVTIVFYLDVAYVLQYSSSGFRVFLQVFQMHVSNVSSDFRRMLQMLHLDVSKLDRVLHLHPRFLLPRLGVFSSPASGGIRCPLPLFSMLVTCRERAGPHGSVKRRGKQL
jgi:hypothetical protein